MIKIINILIVIAFLLALIFFALEETRISKKKRLQILWSAAIFLSALFGIRDFGLDLEPYKIIFSELEILNPSNASLAKLFNPTIEPFFVTLISIIKTADLSYQTFLFTSAAIPIYLITKAIQENSETPILCFLFFCLFFLFKAADAVRHFLAASMYLFALHCLATDRKWHSHSLIVLSCLTHYANLITLLVAPFLRIRWRTDIYIASLLITILIALPLGRILNSTTSDQEIYLAWKLNYYLNNEEFLDYQNNLHKYTLLTLALFYYFSILFINVTSLIKQNHFSKFESLLLNSQIIGSLISTLFLTLGAFALATRILLPLGIGSFFLLARAWHERSKIRKNPALLHITLTTLLLYNFIVILYNAGIHYYKSPFYLG